MELAGASSVNEAHVEKLLSEKLLKGFVLLETCCPACSTPLVKNNGLESSGKDSGGNTKKDPIVVPSSSFDQPFRPVDGVPMCVVCNSHVVTQESEIDILEQCDTFKDKGSILIAMKGSSSSESDDVKRLEEDEFKRAGVHEIINLSHHGEPKQAAVFVEEKPQENTRGLAIPRSKAKEDTELDNCPTEEEYSVRREVATKVLGAKMLQGYTLQETTCDRCGMPLMEKNDDIECVVCPALAKKAKKKMKAEKKLAEEIARLEREVAAKKKSDQEAKTQREEQDRLAREELARIEHERMELEARLRAEAEADRLSDQQRKLELEAEKARLLALEQEEEARIAALEEEEARLLREARERAQEQARQHKEERLESMSRQQAEDQRIAEIQLKTEEKLAMERAKQKEEEIELLEETRRLEELEAQTLSTKTEQMHKDLLQHEHRRRLAGKVALDFEVAKLEEERQMEELEIRRTAEEKRSEEEARVLASLEAEAASKALAAEEAIRKAKAALETVNSTRKVMIAETIAMAEREAIAETEEAIKAEREDYKEKVILPSESELNREGWETLRSEGRAIMTRRVLQGWQLVPEACQGIECQMSPLIMKHGKKECVVCGGSGSGHDGVYLADAEDELDFNEPKIVPESIETDDNKDDSLTDGREEDFEEKRNLVSKEIGKRMLLGWTLLDASCPKCVMPLMMDNHGKSDICVLCGHVEPFFDNANPEHEFEEEEQALVVNRETLVEESSLDQTVDPTNSEMPPEPGEVKSEDLLKTIQERAVKNTATPTSSRSDPPAFTKPVRSKVYDKVDAEEATGEDPAENNKGVPIEEMLQSKFKKDDESKKFDFAEPTAVQELLASAAEYEEDDENVFEFANSRGMYTSSKGMTPGMIAKTFLRSPQGYDFRDGSDMSLEEIKDLVDIFMVANFEEPMSERFKVKVAETVLENLQPEASYHVEPAIMFDIEPNVMKTESTTPTMIHLEDMASPKSTNSPEGRSAPRSFHFDDYADNLSVKSASKRNKPTPETMMMASRSRSMAPNANNDLPPRSPYARKTPRSAGSSQRDGAPVVVGGPLGSGPRHHDYRHRDAKSISEVSRASSVASDALETLYTRIDQCKTKLMDPTNSITEQLATADLLEKLAKAAVAVRNMEKLEENE